MFELTLNESGDAELQLAFQLLELEFSDWRPEFRKIEPEFTIVIQTRFTQEGPGWLQLAHPEQKAKKFPGKTILRATDRLFLSFEKDDPGNISRIEELSAEFGSNVEYATDAAAKRPIIVISQKDDERFMSIAVAEKSRRIREIGFNVKSNGL